MKLNPAAWLLWTADTLVWVATVVGPIKCMTGCCKGQQSVNPPNDKDARRHAKAKDTLASTPYPECKTVHDLMQRTFSAYASCDAQGTRKYLGEHKPEGAKFGVKKFGDTSWIKYDEMGNRVAAFGRGLTKLGMKAGPSGTSLETASGPHIMIIYEETCADWTIACLGAFTQGITVAT